MYNDLIKHFKTDGMPIYTTLALYVGQKLEKPSKPDDKIDDFINEAMKFQNEAPKEIDPCLAAILG